MVEFQIWHWIQIKELEPMYPHKSYRNVNDYWTCAKEIHERGYHVMAVPDKKILFVDTKVFEQR